MATKDKNLRQQAIPYLGQVCGYNRSDNSDQDISNTSVTVVAGTNPSLLGEGDLYDLIQGNSKTDYMIRILRPKHGQIIQAYLNLSLTFDAIETFPEFSVSVGGSFASDNLTANVPSTAFIQSCMNQINPPSGNPYQGAAGQALYVYGVNIQPLIPQVGSANYVTDFYSIGLHFTHLPITGGLFHLSKFFITGSIMVV